MNKKTRELVITLGIILIAVIIFFIFKDNLIQIFNSGFKWVQSLFGLSDGKQFELNVKPTDPGIFG